MAEVASDLEQGFPAKPVARPGAGLIVRADGEGRLRQTHRIENVGARGARLCCRARTDVEVQLIDVRHAGGIEPAGGEMDAQPAEPAREQPRGGLHLYGLRKAHRVEYGVGLSLRQTLHAKITLRSECADDIAGLVDRRDDQAMRRPATHRDPDVMEVVSVGMQSRKAVSDAGREVLLVTGYRGNAAERRDIRFRRYGARGRRKRAGERCGSDSSRDGPSDFSHPSPPSE